jgi:hypothetical protein
MTHPGPSNDVDGCIAKIDFNIESKANLSLPMEKKRMHINEGISLIESFITAH